MSHTFIHYPHNKSDLSEEQQIELNLLEIFYHRIVLCSTSGISSILTFGIIVWYFSLVSNNINIWFWHVLMICIYTTGYGIKYCFDCMPVNINSAKRWNIIFTVYSCICGLGWGIGCSYLCWNTSGISVAMSAAILMCVCSVCVSLGVSLVYSVWVFVLAALPPPAVCLLMKQSPGESFVGMLLFFAMIMIILVAQSMHKGLRAHLRTEIQLRRAVNEAQQARAQADAANSFKSQFLANVSHEIRTPMNAVLGMLKLLQHTKLNVRQADYALKGEGAAKTMLDLFDDILDFSKIEAGKVVLHLQPVHLAQFMQQLMELLQDNIAQKPLQLHLNLDSTLPDVVLCDPLRLRQILMNIGRNAIKFTDQGSITLRVQKIEQIKNTNILRFEVQDTGIGIAPEKQSKIFEGFMQAENLSTRRFGGAGLGLSISKQLVQAMGGIIKIQSTLGLGSTFAFELRMQTIRWNPSILEENQEIYQPTR